jgi:hypothetical protein
MAEHEEYIERLERIEKKTDWIITYLLKRDQPVSPPPYNPGQPGQGGWPEPNIIPTVTKCPRCGVNLSAMMSYSCSRSDCPTGLGGVSFLKG